MTKSQLLDLAKQYLIQDDGMSVAHLIRKIQLAEGNFDCFGTLCAWSCSQAKCRWRRDCLLESAKSAPADF